MEIKTIANGETLINDKLFKSNLKVVKNSDVDSIRCGNCNKLLMKVKSEKSQTKTYKVIVECPFCKDYSFAYEVLGIFRLIPADGVLLADIVSDDEKNLITYKTTRVR